MHPWSISVQDPMVIYWFYRPMSCMSDLANPLPGMASFGSLQSWYGVVQDQGFDVVYLLFWPWFAWIYRMMTGLWLLQDHDCRMLAKVNSVPNTHELSCPNNHCKCNIWSCDCGVLFVVNARPGGRVRVGLLVCWIGFGLHCVQVCVWAFVSRTCIFSFRSCFKDLFYMVVQVMTWIMV